MIKNKLDFKLINVALFVLIVFLMYQTSGLWIGILAKIITIIAPFFFAFIIAYALNPCVRFLRDKGFPKWLSILIVVFSSPWTFSFYYNNSRAIIIWTII